MADIKVKIGAQTSEFSQGIAKAKNLAGEFKSSITSQFQGIGATIAGTFAIGSIGAFFASIMDEAGRFNDLATQFDTTAESIQRISFLAGQSGTDIEAFVKALQKGNAAAYDAVSGNTKLADAFKVLGISAQQWLNNSDEENIIAIADAMEKNGGDAKGLAAYYDVLGTKARELIPAFKGGAEAAREMLDSASVISDEDVQKLDDLGDSLDAMSSKLKADLAPAFVFLGNTVQAVVGLIVRSVETTMFSLVTLGATVKATLAGNIDEAKAQLVELGKEYIKFIDETQKSGKRIIGGDSNSTPETRTGGKSTGDEIDSPATAEADQKKIADLKAKNDAAELKSQREALSLMDQRRQKILEIDKETWESDRAKNALDREIHKEKMLQYIEELKAIDEKIKKEKDATKKIADDNADSWNKQQAEQLKDFEKFQEDKKKKELQDQKKKIEDEIKVAEENVDNAKLLPFNPAVDSLRNVGGGLENVNYSKGGIDVNKEQTQLETAKDQLQVLKDLRDKINAAIDGNDTGSSGGYSF